KNQIVLLDTVPDDIRKILSYFIYHYIRLDKYQLDNPTVERDLRNIESLLVFAHKRRDSQFPDLRNIYLNLLNQVRLYSLYREDQKRLGRTNKRLLEFRQTIDFMNERRRIKDRQKSSPHKLIKTESSPRSLIS